MGQLIYLTNLTLKGRFPTDVIKIVSSKVTQAGVGGEVVRVGVSSRTGSDKAGPSPGCGRGGGQQGRCLSHLIGGAEGRLAQLADLPDVFPGHHPSPPETPTYHALTAGEQAQRRWALRFAADRGDTEVETVSYYFINTYTILFLSRGQLHKDLLLLWLALDFR